MNNKNLIEGFSHKHLRASRSTRSAGGARGIGLILISSVYEVDSIERPFQDRCRAPRAEDMWPGCTQILAFIFVVPGNFDELHNVKINMISYLDFSWVT